MQQALKDWQDKVRVELEKVGVPLDVSKSEVISNTDPDWEVKPQITWAYGITTVPSRGTALLKLTVDSLGKAGFPNPVIFLDGMNPDWEPPLDEFRGIVSHSPNVGQLANWSLALTHLAITQPFATYYAIFEDDLIASANLREYLEQIPYQELTYWNLYTHDCNLIAPGPNPNPGFHNSNQRGKGALGLVFSRKTALDIIGSPIFANRSYMAGGPKSKHPFIASDGMVIEALQPLGYTELIHIPSLLQHTGGGTQSTLEHGYTECSSFRGEDFNLLTLIEGRS